MPQHATASTYLDLVADGYRVVALHIAPVVLFRVRVLRGVRDATWISAFFVCRPTVSPLDDHGW